MGEPKQYLIGRVQEALAHDPRLGELDVQVKVVDRKVFLSGAVATTARCAAIAEVVTELLPDHEIHNQVVVAARDEDPAAEELT
jgi:osmotically-inducible protein OsmY